MKKAIITSLLTISAVTCLAQRDFKAEYEAFKNQTKKEYNDFRSNCNKEYADFMRKAWATYKGEKPIPQPKEEPAPPIPTISTIPPTISTVPIVLDTIIPAPKPHHIPQPQPIEPIKETPRPDDRYHTFSFFGTSCKVRLDDRHKFSINNTDEASIADSWEHCSLPLFNNVIFDCLELRKSLNLCDFAYLEMLHEMSESFFGSETNAATLLMAYIYCQSGYKMKLAISNDRLYMMYATRHTIYRQSYFLIDNTAYYPYRMDSESCRICHASFPNEQPLSLEIGRQMALASKPSAAREIKSATYPDVKVSVSVNKNLIDFYNNYPASEIDDNFMSKWAMYANTPASPQIKEALYPALREAIKGKTPHAAVSRILNFVQTGFTYGYDSKIWGYDRAFFADETLYYPYCDCEDRSILFSRIVRDLLSLEVVLVYYPGHLATAVHFNEEVKGDYIPLNGKKFTVCDPTFVGARVGMTMPDLDNMTATVILLE
ncbi:MAG: hypothetical protein IJY31_03520 [Muribaculaceae bacterium]|nr:hypothetical protein [Muribaculaceae bacterium]